MKALGFIVEQYLAFAQTQVLQHIAMNMSDWISNLDAILTLNCRELLTHAGNISHALNDYLRNIIYQLQFSAYRSIFHFLSVWYLGLLHE